MVMKKEELLSLFSFIYLNRIIYDWLEWTVYSQINLIKMDHLKATTTNAGVAKNNSY